MNIRDLTNEDILQINMIIKEINDEKEKLKFGLIKFLDEDKCIGLILLLFKKFYGDKINDGIYAVILKDWHIRIELIDIFFKYSELLPNLDINSNSIRISYGKRESFNNKDFLQIGVFSNYIYLNNKNIIFRFWENELEITYKSKLGEHCKETLLFDKDGLVSERRIEKKIIPIRVNGVEGYGCNNVVCIKRCDSDPCYVTIVNELKITSGIKLKTMPVKEFSGYIFPLFLFDLKISDLSDTPVCDVINGESCFRENGLIDVFFSNIKKAFIDRLDRSKNNGFTKKRKNNV